jgi:hypothetical protein
MTMIKKDYLLKRGGFKKKDGAVLQATSRDSRGFPFMEVREDESGVGIVLILEPGKFSPYKMVYKNATAVNGWKDEKVKAKYLAHHANALSENLSEYEEMGDSPYANLMASQSFRQRGNTGLLVDEENPTDLDLLSDRGVSDLIGESDGYRIDNHPTYARLRNFVPKNQLIANPKIGSRN